MYTRIDEIRAYIAAIALIIGLGAPLWFALPVMVICLYITFTLED